MTSLKITSLIFSYLPKVNPVVAWEADPDPKEKVALEFLGAVPNENNAGADVVAAADPNAGIDAKEKPFDVSFEELLSSPAEFEFLSSELLSF